MPDGWRRRWGRPTVHRAGEVVVFALFNSAGVHAGVACHTAARRNRGADQLPAVGRRESRMCSTTQQPARVHLRPGAPAHWSPPMRSPCTEHAAPAARSPLPAPTPTPTLSLDAFLSSGSSKPAPIRNAEPGPARGRTRPIYDETHPAIHVGHDRNAQRRVAVQQPGRGAVGPRRDHALPALAPGPDDEHDTVVSPRRVVLRRPQSGSVRRRRGRRPAKPVRSRGGARSGRSCAA